MRLKWHALEFGMTDASAITVQKIFNETHKTWKKHQATISYHRNGATVTMYVRATSEVRQAGKIFDVFDEENPRIRRYLDAKSVVYGEEWKVKDEWGNARIREEVRR